jgi:RHS repeat-associated protein
VQETEFVYDLEGNLIGEYDDGTPIREYVYLNGVPVLQVEGATKFYLHPDPLGTPRSATDSAKDIVWTWGGEAFGSNLPDEDPDNDSTDTTVNLRFPGQYFDAETGHHYSYFRDYEPLMGRYVQSDPIGLLGGLNQFTYVDLRPTSAMDPLGLDASLYPKDAAIADPSDYTGPPLPNVPIPLPAPGPIYGPFGPVCGSGALQASWVPDGGPRLAYACWVHDRCYETCGKSKEECDIDFLRNSAGNLAYFYFIVRKGGEAYEKAQIHCNDC